MRRAVSICAVCSTMYVYCRDCLRVGVCASVTVC